MKLCALAFLLMATLATRAAEMPKLSAYVLGKADQPAPEMLSMQGDEACTVKAVGREATAGNDEGVFAGFQTEAPHFTFVARIAKGIADGTVPKYGLAVRPGLTGNEKAVTLRYDRYEKHQCLQWFMRHYSPLDTHEGSGRCFLDGIDKRFAAREGVWLKIVRRYPFIELYASADGKAWQEINYRPVLMAAKLWVGFQVTAGGAQDAAAAFDNIRFTVDSVAGDSPATFRELPPPRSYTIYFAKVNTGDAAAPVYKSFSLIVPDGTDMKKVRCLWWLPGDKEIDLANGSGLAFRSGPTTQTAGLRLPADFDQDEGAYRTDKLDPKYAVLAHEGLLTMGSLDPSYPAAVKRLAEISGIRELANLPFVTTGASAAGGAASRAAQMHREFAVAAAPTLIGSAGMEGVDKHRDLPTLWVVGSQDGNHLQQVTAAAPICREQHALWGSAPMWSVHHRNQKKHALLYPYFIEIARLRVPAQHDFAAGPAKLTPLREEDGWLGLIDTWQGNCPQAAPFKDFKGDLKKTVWLPNERVARAWQAFVSNRPLTVIHFPAFDGECRPGVQRHNSLLAAGEPFEIVASGPTGGDVKVEFFYDAQQPLKVRQAQAGNPYRITAEGLPAGVHVIYAVTTIAGEREISRPVPAMFLPRQR